MNVKSHRKIITIFFGLLVMLYITKIFGVLNEKLIFLYETKILKTITESITSFFLSYIGAWLGTGGTLTSKGINFGVSADSFHSGNRRGKEHSFIAPSIALIISVFVPGWIKPFLIGYSLGYAIHIIVDWLNNSNAFMERKFILVSFILYVVLIILFELF